MKKFILVVFVGMVLAINLYGFVSKLMVEEIEEFDPIAETTITVYEE